MTLHLIYRSHGAENLKDRPPYYSKSLALASVIDAAQRCSADRVDMVFVNDGPIPAERTAQMRSAGEIVPVSRGSNRSSYLFALGLARRRSCAPEDIMLFAEDDYLYRADAIEQLAHAARIHTDIDYFYPYSEIPEPAQWDASRPPAWVPHPTTTSTFAVRAAALHHDEHILRAAPFTGGDWDHASLLSVQGTQPFTLMGVIRHPRRQQEASAATRVARAAVLTITKAGVSVLAWRQGRRVTRRAVAACPPLATHLEVGHLAWGTDWAQRASELQSKGASG